MKGDMNEMGKVAQKIKQAELAKKELELQMLQEAQKSQQIVHGRNERTALLQTELAFHQLVNVATQNIKLICGKDIEGKDILKELDDLKIGFYPREEEPKEEQEDGAAAGN